MRLTPLDIREQQFKRVMRGLDAEEVAGFLETVAREFEAMVAENQELRGQIQHAQEKLEDYTRMEKALRDTLIGAERIVADSRDTARKQADLVLREAELSAQQATSRVTGQVAALRQELLELRKARDAYASRLRWLLQSHLDSVNGLENDFVDLDSRLFGGPSDVHAVVPRLDTRSAVPVQSDPPSLAGDRVPTAHAAADVGPPSAVTDAPGATAPDASARAAAPAPASPPAPDRILSVREFLEPPVAVNTTPLRPANLQASNPPQPASSAPPAAPPPNGGVRPRAFPESHLEMWPPVGGPPAYDAGALPPGPNPDRVRREPGHPSSGTPVEGLSPSSWSMERFREELME